MNELISWFKHESGYDKTFTYQTIMDHTYKIHTEETAASMAMRLLIHYVGDIHQPLHASSRINDEFPAGDRGGNSFKLTEKDQGELHALWDSVIGEFQGYAKLPFSSPDWDTLGKNAKRLMADYKIDSSVATNLSPAQWAEDSYKLTSTFVYDKLE